MQWNQFKQQLQQDDKLRMAFAKNPQQLLIEKNVQNVPDAVLSEISGGWNPNDYNGGGF